MIDDPRKWLLTEVLYMNRASKCGETQDYAFNQLVEFRKQNWTVPKLKQFLKERDKSFKSTDKKTDLIKKAEDHYKYMMSGAKSREDAYRKQLNVLYTEVRQKQLFPLFEEMNNKVKEKQDIGETLHIKDAIDYDQFEKDWITHFKNEEGASQVYNALKEHTGEVCFLHGGSMIRGYGGYDMVYIDRVHKNTEKYAGQDEEFITVGVDLVKMTDNLVAVIDYCDIENDKGVYFKRPEEYKNLVDFEKTHRTIGSWKIACSNE